MHLLRPVVLYTALALCANAAVAAGAAADLGPQDLGPYMNGDMRKLVTASSPGAPLEATLLDAADAEHPLSTWRGKYVLLNFWATWCAPCRNEMATLDRLQAEMGGDHFQVLTIATGRNPVPAIDKFFADENITHLPKLRDPRQVFAREMGVLGLPVSVILDPEGREIARLTGDAAWDGKEARALIAALVAAEG